MDAFSRRKGLVPISQVIQTNGMTDELRNSLWNVLDTSRFSIRGFLYDSNARIGYVDQLSQALWADFFKRPIDMRPRSPQEMLAEIRQYFFSCQWYEIYDFIEFVLSYYHRGGSGNSKDLEQKFNIVLERELAGYRIVNRHVVDITSEEEVKALGEAIEDRRFPGVTAHLSRSLELLADRTNPDYRNSIKESISAVESMARIVANNAKATLPDALKALEKSGHLHAALRDGFVKLYGYTSDADGIRHAMLDEPDLTQADAKFFLLSCTSFINYLKSQLS